MHNRFFEEMASAFSRELQLLGVKTAFSDGFPTPEKGRAYVLLAPHEHLIQWGHSGVPVQPLARTICICTEQAGTSWFEGATRIAAKSGAVFDINVRGAKLQRERGISAEHLPLGYTEAWERPASQSRELDLLFLGGATERRVRMLAEYGSMLARFRSQLLMADTQLPQVDALPGLVARDEKLGLLARTRVVINLHRGWEPYFEWMRVLEAIHCGAVVVSELSRDYEPLVPGEHLLFAHPASIHHVAERLLTDEDERRRIAASALDFIKERMPLRRSAEKLAAAAEEVADRPLPTGWSATRRIRSRPFETPLREILAPPGGTDNGVMAGIMALKKARLEAMNLRRRLDGLAAERHREGPLPEVETVKSSPAHAETAPRVTVICALYNHAGHIAGALDSVKDQRFGDWELVVCDDGSTDGSGKVVEDWIEANPERAALLVRHPVNRGLPAARNTAVERARGEYVLVLDADNELYPNCLERLTEALDNDPKAAFAYGILEQFDRNGPVGLSGYFGWEPERLVEENYIDALALIRRETLQQLGGYIEDRRIYGWEDYDLWCRVAEAGERAAHVAEIVARYRLSAGSMITLTNLSVGDAREAIAERSPALFEGHNLADLDRPRRGAEKALAFIASKGGKESA